LQTSPPANVNAEFDIYSSLGVRPIINCDHVKTILGGSLALPEVIQAMRSASDHFVHLDELMEAVGKRLAVLTGSDFCIVTSGCAAAITHATSACIAGGDPEKLRRLPNLAGLKNEVIIPRYSRNLYDQAVRMLGVTVREVGTMEELQSALSSRTALVYMLGLNDAGVGWLGDKIPPPFLTLGVKAVADCVRAKGVPLFVDAAAEGLTVPNVYLQRGATLVGYSGGKVLRGPQCCGLLMGREDLVRAAWINSAPHHSYGRPMKVGKEEIAGMLAAVEMWFKRDHAAEWKQWESWLEVIAKSVTRVDGVSAEILEGPALSLNCPTLVLKWDGAKLGVSAETVKKLLEAGTPRIFLGESTGDRLDPSPSSITIRSLNMKPGEARTVSEHLYEVLARPGIIHERPLRESGTVDMAGRWNVHIQFVCGSADHAFSLQQQGTQVTGIHQGEFLTGELSGRIAGDQVSLKSAQKYEGNWLNYKFVGRVAGNAMTGTVDLGQYGQARWDARKA
jgi:L-seryl-tRNA(Ser) seleniumtransferase